MIDFDVVLEHIGGFGRYQIMLVVMVCYYSIPSGMNSLAPVFMNYRPEYRCNVPPIDNQTVFPNLTESDILNLTTPYNSAGYETCYRYGYDLSACASGSLDCVNKSAPSMKCDLGFHYDTSIFPRTVITEFDLVCDKSYWDPLATSIYMVGILVGSTVFGALSDKLGRRLIMISCCILSFFALIGCSFVHNYILFVVCRFMVSCFGFGCFLTSFVYLMEITTNRFRTLIGVSFQLFFAVGYMILSGIAYQWRDWHDMNLATGIIGLPYAVFLFFIPESPRWLFSNGKDEKGKEISRKFAKFNQKLLDEEVVWNEAEQQADGNEKEALEKKEKSYSIPDLFKGRGIRIITIKLMISWFINSFVYYGISLNAGALAGDIFVNNMLNGVMEIVSYVIVIILMDRIGRRIMGIAMLSLASVGLLCSTVVSEYATSDSLNDLSVAFAFIGKIGISGSYAVIYNFTSELYPTVLRSNGIGMSSTASRFGSILSPLVIALQNYISWLPNVIFGVLAAIAAVISYTLPETSGRNMMETLEEAEDFYNGTTSKKSSSNFPDEWSNSLKTSESKVGKVNKAFEGDDLTSKF